MIHWQLKFWLTSIAKHNTRQELSKNVLDALFLSSKILIINLVAIEKGLGCHPIIKPF
jgi:hypothetical protein